MQFIPTTKDEEKQLFQEMGVANISDLINAIPKHLQIKDDLGIGEPLSEMEIKALLILTIFELYNASPLDLT